MSSNNPNRVYLDTETTGLHPEEGDEILSLTIVDANGRLLFDERFKPKHKKEWPEAQAVNHISPEDVEHLTIIDTYMEQICRILDHIADEIVGYNVAFDLGFLKAAGAAINPDAVIIDTMQEFMNAFGNSNTGHRYQPLSMAAERLGYERFRGASERLLGPQPPRPPVCRHGADSSPAPEFRKTLRTSRYHHPVHTHDRQPVVRQGGTVPAKPARPICRYRTRGKCLEQPA